MLDHDMLPILSRLPLLKQPSHMEENPVNPSSTGEKFPFNEIWAGTNKNEASLAPSAMPPPPAFLLPPLISTATSGHAHRDSQTFSKDYPELHRRLGIPESWTENESWVNATTYWKLQIKKVIDEYIKCGRWELGSYGGQLENQNATVQSSIIREIKDALLEDETYHNTTNKYLLMCGGDWGIKHYIRLRIHAERKKRGIKTKTG